MNSNTLFLILTRHWFEMIASGEKKEDYREIKPYWSKRLSKKYDTVTCQMGYEKNAPRVVVKFEGVEIKRPKPEWSGSFDGEVYAIKLGKIL